MGAILSSIKRQRPLYTAAPLVCLGVTGYAYYVSAYWDAGEPSNMVTFLYLGSLALNFGSQIWHYFIASQVMLQALPRPSFGEVQSEMFPRLFMLNNITSTINLSVFMIRHPFYELETAGDYYEFYALLASLLSNVVMALALNPLTDSTMRDVRRIEKDHNLQEISAKKAHPGWVRAHTTFLRAHGAGFAVSLLGVAATGTYLYFLADRLRDL